MLKKKLIIALQAVVLVAFSATLASAKSTKNDQAPPPPAVPVPKVNQAPLAPPGPQILEGPAMAVDGDTIALGDRQVRLTGIMAPALSTEHGPAARVTLDGLLARQRVDCTIFDKTPDGDARGQCSVNGNDLALSLLSQGLAAVFRDGNAGDSAQQALATKYDTAEAQARQHDLGIWAQSPQQPAAAVAQQDPPMASQPRAFIAYALLLIAIFTTPITLVSIFRNVRRERQRLRRARRYTLSTGLTAEAEIIRASARRILAQVADFPNERPLPGSIGAMLGLPNATFWNAHAVRLHVLPVEVTVPLLRLHAVREDAARKLAVAGAVPLAVITSSLNELATAAERAIESIETSLGIKREKPAAAAPTPAAAASDAPAAATPAEKQSGEKKDESTAKDATS